MNIILLLFIINQDIDFEDIFNKATTSLVKFQVVKDSASQKFITLGQDSLLADTTIDFLISKFDTKSASERHEIKNILKKIGKSAIKGIVKKIDYRGSDKESRCLKQSLWVLGEIGGENIVEPAARFIEDEQWQIRSAAYTTLGKSKSIKALPHIIRGLDDSISIVRKSTYYALSEVATEDEIPYLIDGLDDEFYGIRYAAVQGLINVGKKAFKPLLRAIGKNPSKDYSIFKCLLKLDIDEDEKGEIIKISKEKEAPIRLLIYQEFEDENLLKPSLEFEKNEMLRNYIIKKIFDLQQ